MRPFTLPALWTIWRCGVPEVGFDTIKKFSTTIGTPIEEIVEGLAEDGLLEVIRKRDTEKHYSFLKLTEKGLELVYEDEAPRWREAMRHISYKPPAGPCVQAAGLRAEGKKFREIALAMKLSVERASVLCRQYTRQKKAYQDRMDAAAHFIAGVTPFMDLPVDVLGPFSVRLANTLYRAEIKTVPQLLATPSCKLLRMANCGRKQIHEINAALERCKAVPLEWQYWDVNSAYLRDP